MAETNPKHPHGGHRARLKERFLREGLGGFEKHNILELLLFFGFIYICEAGSVVIQVSYFKATHGKRIFKMTPIHHSFEMDGWSEEKIVASFSLVAAAAAALGLVFIRLS